MNGKLRIYFENAQKKEPVDYHLKMLVRRAIEATLAYEGVRGKSEVSVTFTDNAGIHLLNRKFRGVDRETDVLSFPLFEDDPGCAGHMLGDIVLSLEKCREQSELYGHSFERECAFLTVHSTLHLLGYDHERSEAEDNDMRARQSAITDGMGLSVKKERKE
ncbi:MAG: rRNA maturation RNase YbeY [Clostridia bacterium]|nr:rRNA maturation RNase YbeY [Clostridia bacterium]MDD7700232.1 rRNA maturation RNase YbeY [Eubacteriales bacterium]MDY2827110.1 rRNA maturation RNase YbeY [Eubacteriales bacterium]